MQRALGTTSQFQQCLVGIRLVVSTTVSWSAPSLCQEGVGRINLISAAKRNLLYQQLLMHGKASGRVVEASLATFEIKGGVVLVGHSPRQQSSILGCVFKTPGSPAQMLSSVLVTLLGAVLAEPRQMDAKVVTPPKLCNGFQNREHQQVSPANLVVHRIGPLVMHVNISQALHLFHHHAQPNVRTSVILEISLRIYSSLPRFRAS